MVVAVVDDDHNNDDDDDYEDMTQIEWGGKRKKKIIRKRWKTLKSCIDKKDKNLNSFSCSHHI